MESINEELLERYGWTVECYSPFEISTKDGSFARDEGAQYVVDGIEREEKYRLRRISRRKKTDH